MKNRIYKIICAVFAMVVIMAFGYKKHVTKKEVNSNTISKVEIPFEINGSEQLEIIRSDQRINRIENSLVDISTIEDWLKREHYDTLQTNNLQEQIKKFNIPGLSIALINDFKIEWTKQYGVKRSDTKEPVTDSTIFQSGSATKLLSAVLVLQLVEQGMLDLDTDINSYLNSWKMPEHESGKKVTLRMLLTHTAGINRPGDGIWHEGDTFPTLIQILKGEYPSISEEVKFLHEPGSTHSYSNHGYLIIQQILQDVYNQEFVEIVEQKIFNPLQMNSCCIEYPLPEKIQRNFIKGHDADGEVSEDDDLHPYALAQGGWMTNPTDMAKFGIELMNALNGKSRLLLSQESARMLLETEFFTENFEGGIKQQGLGCFLLGEGEDKYFFHPGHNSPGANALLICHPKSGNGAAIMTNGMRGLNFVIQLVPAIAKEYQWESVSN